MITQQRSKNVVKARGSREVDEEKKRQRQKLNFYSIKERGREEKNKK